MPLRRAGPESPAPGGVAGRRPTAHGRQRSATASAGAGRVRSGRSVRTGASASSRAHGGLLRLHAAAARTLEDYLDLVAAVEATAAELGMPVMLEGYPPPRDPRLKHFSGHARPGRDRGQHPPGAAWDELVDAHRPRSTRRRARRGLATEKFMLDGRHTGTGGGNHFVLGGADAGRQPVPAPARPAAQPARLLAQPPVAVLPVLGPVHRPDQPGAARGRGAQRQPLRAGDRLRQIAEPQRGDARPGWWTALFRNLLVDVTGNTHRDRVLHRQALLARTAATGRLGLVELRAFEMPPHARMSLRAAAADARAGRALLETPYDRRLVRWGTELHDRFMLPHFVAAGLPRRARRPARAPATPFDAAWFAPHLEFRFPLVGEVDAARRRARAAPGARALARAGRGGGGGGTVALRRFVASSACRAGSPAGSTDRHVVACNGRAVPLHPTGTERRVRRRRALQGLAARRRPAPDDPGARAAGLRPRRHLERPLARRLHLPRRRIPAGATTTPSRSTPTRPRPAPRAVLPLRPHAGPDDGAAGGASKRAAAHAGPAPRGLTSGAGRGPLEQVHADRKRSA